MNGVDSRARMSLSHQLSGGCRAGYTAAHSSHYLEKESMLRRLLFSLAAVSALAIAGCAHSPQQLDPNPKINGSITPVGQGQPVSVRVVDGRPSPTLGTRGGLYPETSAVIVPKEKVVPKLQAQAEAAVRLLGFTPSPNAYNAPQLTLTLAELKYQSPKEGLYVTEATIGATFRVEVQNGGRRYTGRYGASLNQRFGMAPNEQTNTKLVSDVLSDALSRAFRDQSIGQVLSQ
jgi:uncharacterized lipoprotein